MIIEVKDFDGNTMETIRLYTETNIRNSIRHASDKQVYSCLSELLKYDKIPSRFFSFAVDLCDFFFKHGFWTQKQSLCARRMISLNADKVCEIVNGRNST